LAQISKAEQLKDTPIWAFHGALDDIVPVDQMSKMINAVEQYQSNLIVEWPANQPDKLAGRTVRMRLKLEKKDRVDPRVYAVYLVK
jgi:predicted peptidase